jgi:hypothetical protein
MNTLPAQYLPVSLKVGASATYIVTSLIGRDRPYRIELTNHRSERSG